MIKEAVILAGGIGTRLSHVVKHIPKPMAEVSGRPFLEYLLDYLLAQNLNRVILSVGYKHEIITRHFGNSYKGLKLFYSVEKEPLGTGGGIKAALDLIEQEHFFAFNGDTYFDVSLSRLYQFHNSKEADLSVALKPMKDFSRYGTIELNSSARIVRFKERESKRRGLINGGVYLVEKSVFCKTALIDKFSFEKDFLEKYSNNYFFYGLPFADNFFIDIGVPGDYKIAQVQLQKYIADISPTEPSK